jgi:hypothetical protein
MSMPEKTELSGPAKPNLMETLHLAPCHDYMYVALCIHIESTKLTAGQFTELI